MNGAQPTDVMADPALGHLRLSGGGGRNHLREQPPESYYAGHPSSREHFNHGLFHRLISDEHDRCASACDEHALARGGDPM